MKKSILLSLVCVLVTVTVQAQTPEPLTNNSVINMTKANLSDAVIIDMIRNSELKFDLSDEALKVMAGEGVSSAVLDVMKEASAVKASGQTVTYKPAPVPAPVPAPAEDLPEAEEVVEVVEVAEEAEEAEEIPVEKPMEKAVEEAKEKAEEGDPLAAEVHAKETIDNKPGIPPAESMSVTPAALNYVAPLTELISFNETEFKTLEVNISEWDKQVMTLVADITKVKNQMSMVENELRDKKNADTQTFSADIMELKKKLDIYRKNYQQSKEIMADGGQKVVKKIEAEMTSRIRNLSKAYASAGQMIGSFETDLASGAQAVAFNYGEKEISPTTTPYMVYATDMLYWYRNEMNEIAKTINEWNPRVSVVLKEDEILRNQLESMESKIEELKLNSKLNKDEISSLKKQVSKIEKERKQLTDRMKDDARELASQLKKVSQRNQDSVKERFTDIIENTTYSFGERFGF